MSNKFESFIAMADHRDTSVGYFEGKQKEFDKARKHNGGYINSLDLEHLVENGVNYYKLTYTLIDKHGFILKFIARIEENPAEEKRLQKTTIRTSMIEGEKTHSLPTKVFETTSYHQKAGEWLDNALFAHKDYKYQKVTLTLPPTYAPITETKCEKIKQLIIKVPLGEERTDLVNWWLSEFKMTIRYIKIENQSTTKIRIKDNKRLKSIPRVDINGTCDIDYTFLKEFRGDCIYWRDMAVENKLSITDLQNVCMGCVETKELKAIFLEQGDQEMLDDIVAKLGTTYGHQGGKANVEGVNYFFKRKNVEFRLRGVNGGIMFGIIEETAHMNRLSALNWPETD